MTKTSLRTALRASTAIAGALLFALPASAQNLPDTGNVTAVTAGLGGTPGSTTPVFTPTPTPTGTDLRVDLKDNRTILTWGGTGFDIAAGNSVNFKDSRATSGVTNRTDNIAVLNRDLSGGSSNILGSLTSDANVAVYLINRNGMLFGGSSVVNTGAFFAGDADLTSDSDFLTASSTLRFATNTVGDGLTIEHGAQMQTASSASSSGGRMGDIVLMGSRILYAGSGTEASIAAGGDVGMVVASDVTVQNAPGSPLSFTINRGRDAAAFNAELQAGGTISGQNIVLAAARSGSGNPASIAVLGTLTATGAIGTDHGIVLTAGAASSPVVTLASAPVAGNTAAAIGAGGTIVNTGSINAKTIRVAAGTGISGAGSWTASGLIDLKGGSFAAGSLSSGGSTSFTGSEFSVDSATVGGDLTINSVGTASDYGWIVKVANATIAGNLQIATPGTAIFGGTVAVGGTLTTSANIVQLGTANPAPATVTANGDILLTANGTRFDSQIRATGAGSVLQSNADGVGGGDIVLDVFFGNTGQSIALFQSTLSAGTAGQRTNLKIIYDSGTQMAFGTVNANALLGAPGQASPFVNGLTLNGSVGSISFTQANLHDTLKLTGGAVSVTNANVTAGDIVLRANITDLQAVGTLTASGNIDLTAVRPGGQGFGGNILAGTLVAGGNITATATGGGNIQITNTNASGSLTINSGGQALLGSTTNGGFSTVGGNIQLTSTGNATLRGNISAGGALTVSGLAVTLGNTANSQSLMLANGAVTITSTNIMNGRAGLILQSNADGVGSEALTLIGSGTIDFSPLSTLLGGTARQSDVQIRNPAAAPVVLGAITARALLGASGTDLFTNGLTRTNALALRGMADLTNTLRLDGSSVQVGTVSINTGGIDIRSASALSFAGALNASGSVLARTSSGTLTITATGSISGAGVTLSTPGNFINFAGHDAVIATGGTRWLIYSAGQTYGVNGALNSNNTAIWNRTIDSGPIPQSGNRYVFAYQPTLTFSTPSRSKEYGTDLTNGPHPVSVSGFQAGGAGLYLPDTFETAFSGDPLITSAGFAPRASVAGSPYAITIGLGTLQSAAGYAFAFGSGSTLTVTPKALTGTVAINTKTYDGTTGATGAITLGGVVSGDSVVAKATYAFADKNAGTDKNVNVSNVRLIGADSGNYTLSLSTAFGTILKKALTSWAGVNTKTYDGTTTGTGYIALDGIVDGDSVMVKNVTLTFADKNAGAGKTVYVSGRLTGADAGNYSVTLPATTTGDILRRQITVTADDLAKNQGQPDPALTYQVTAGSLVSGDAFSGALTRAAGEAPGSYAITQGTLTAGSNYKLTFQAGTLLIRSAASLGFTPFMRRDGAGVGKAGDLDQ
ncbi:MAG: YDG domain-containing protein [Pseudomonadota bacterium]